MTGEPSTADAGPAHVTGELAVAWFATFDAMVAAQAAWLTDLDAAIGDADHGTIMRHGAAAIARDVHRSDEDGLGPLLTTAGTAFGAAAGGAGGILFATFFQGLAAAVAGRDAVSLGSLADAVAAGVACVQVRGTAELGDKTMVDALVPAVVALRKAATAHVPLIEAVARGSTSAASGRDATFPLIARRGRASYLGDRSREHLDPGAATASILLESLATAARTT